MVCSRERRGDGRDSHRYFKFVGMEALHDIQSTELLALLPTSNLEEFEATVRRIEDNTAGGREATSPWQDRQKLKTVNCRVQSLRGFTAEMRERDDVPREVLHALAESADGRACRWTTIGQHTRQEDRAPSRPRELSVQMDTAA